jgi:hypothetical protein
MNNRPNLYKQNPVDEVLLKSDEDIKNYVEGIVDKFPGKIDTLTKLLNNKNQNANRAIDKAIDLVSNGLAGHSANREEAIEKLKKWASGEMKTKITNQLNELDRLGKELGSDNLINLNAMPMGDIDFFASMQNVGQKYLVCEEMVRRTTMALNHLQIKLLEKNQNTYSKVMTK